MTSNAASEWRSLSRSAHRILVATDCLSEGVNLQEHFNSVMHYDLPWNPNRLEQREGRVDRFGQPRDEVKTVLLYGANNPVDQVVLEVLIRKARKIRRDLGIAVPVPMDTEQVILTVVDNVLLRGARKSSLNWRSLRPKQPVHEAWDAAAEREKSRRGYFSQHGIQPDEVAREIEATDAVLGDRTQCAAFSPTPYSASAAVSTLRGAKIAYSCCPLGLSSPSCRISQTAASFRSRSHSTAARMTKRFILAVPSRWSRVFAMPYWARRFRLRARIASLGRARCSRTRSARWTALNCCNSAIAWSRQRKNLPKRSCLPLSSATPPARTGSNPMQPPGRELAEKALPKANISREERTTHIERALNLIKDNPNWFRPILDWRVAELDAAHKRIRALLKEHPLKIHPHTPPDILGCFVLIPVKGAIDGASARSRSKAD